MAKYSKDQIKILAKQLRDKKDREKPFNLLTGAGCSKSANIPLASELVTEIHEKFGDECRQHLEPHQMNDYGACMGCLSKNERRELLEPYLNNSKINWAHIAIASLMHAGYIGRVITFNFDSILARACSLLGLYPATYDFAAAATVDTDYIAPQAIIHLHGQGFGKSLLNSDGETQQHVENIRPLIRDTLQNNSLLVIGYSGVSDAVFPLLQEEYKGRERLWWAGYEDECNHLTQSIFENNKRTAEYLGGCDADRFLIELAQELKCFPPKLFKDPYGHILEELNPVTEFPLLGSSDSSATDILRNLRIKLTKAQQVEIDVIDDLNNFMMQGDWKTILEKADETNTDHHKNLSWAYTVYGDILSDTAEALNNMDIFSQSFEKYKKATEIKPDFYEAFNNWGYSLYNLAKLKDDEYFFKQAIEKYTQAVTIKPDNQEIIFNWGNALIDLATLTESESLAEQSIEKYKQVTNIRNENHTVFNNWANALLCLGKLQKDENLFRQSFEKYKTSIAIKPNYALAYDNWGNALLGLYALDKNIQHVDDAIELLESLEKLDNERVYNLACAYACKGNLEKCKEKLFHCKSKNTLPKNPKTHLQEDMDLENIRNLDWFGELLADLPD